jgi:hypothetical protein
MSLSEKTSCCSATLVETKGTKVGFRALLVYWHYIVLPDGYKCFTAKARVVFIRA